MCVQSKSETIVLEKNKKILVFPYKHLVLTRDALAPTYSFQSSFTDLL